MDNSERIDSIQVAIKSAVDGKMPDVWTSLPGIVQSYNAEKGTCEVQPSVQVSVTAKDGKRSNVSLPLLVDVPVHFPSGGGFTLTFPVKKGDEGLVVFSCRCIDAWWQNGGVQPQAEMRMHDLSDGFLIAGFRSQARKLSSPSTDGAQLRSDDGSTFVGLTANGIALKTDKKISADSSVEINLTAPVIKLNGGIVVNGIVSGQVGGGGTINLGSASMTTDGNVVSQGKNLAGHVHGGVQPGGGTSGTPS